MPYLVNTLGCDEGMWDRSTDCLKRAGVVAKGMERKWITLGVDGELVRPVREPSRGWVKVWVCGGGDRTVSDIATKPPHDVVVNEAR